jgi:hypothetical protein
MQIDYFFMTLGVIFVILMIHLIVTRVFKKTIEGLQSETAATTTSANNGIGANSSSYDSTVAIVANSLKDQNGISTYSTQYDSILEKQISILYQQMLQKSLSMNVSAPDPTVLTTITQLHSTILALDDLRIFVKKK